MTPEDVVRLHEGLVRYHAERYAQVIPTWEVEDLEQEARTAVWQFALKRPGDDLTGGGASQAIKYRLGKMRHRFLKHGAALQVKSPFLLGSLATDVQLDSLRVKNLAERDQYPSNETPYDDLLGVRLSPVEQRICAGVAAGGQFIEVFTDMGLTRRQGQRIIEKLRHRIEEARDE